MPPKKPEHGFALRKTAGKETAAINKQIDGTKSNAELKKLTEKRVKASAKLGKGNKILKDNGIDPRTPNPR